MNLLYWNLMDNKNDSYVADLLDEQKVDFAIFSEYHNTDLEKVIDTLQGGYKVYSGYGGCDKVIAVAKTDMSVNVNREHSRYVMYSVNYNGEKYIIVGAHLPSNPHTDANGRKMVIRELLADLKEQEAVHGITNSIIIGDFNASPFDEELIEKDAFNAVLFKEIIANKEYITYQRTRFRLLYNPILTCISEHEHQYGSFYYSSGIKTLYWYCYDQLLMTKELIHNFVGMKYCREIKGKSLLKNISPNKSISDHLPLLAKFERRGENE